MSADPQTDSIVPARSNRDIRAELLLTFGRLHNRWLGGRHNPDVEPTLLCFTYAGGAAAAFRGWEDVLSANVRPILLPGRDSRMDESPYTRLKHVISDLTDHVGSQITSRTVVFGHSMGALLAFEFTRELRRRQLQLPVKLLLSAFRAPHLDNPKRPIHRWPDEVLKAVLRKEGVPSATLQNAQIMEALLPTLRADLELCDTYEYVDEAPLAVPFAIYGGTDDIRVTEAALKAWDRHTSEGVSHTMINGPHLFINTSRDELLAAVERDLPTECGDDNAC